MDSEQIVLCVVCVCCIAVAMWLMHGIPEREDKSASQLRQALTDLAAANERIKSDRWIKIELECEMPYEEEKVCVWNGYHWNEMRYFPRAPWPLGEGSTHWRRIAPPA